MSGDKTRVIHYWILLGRGGGVTPPDSRSVNVPVHTMSGNRPIELQFSPTFITILQENNISNMVMHGLFTHKVLFCFWQT